MIAEQQHTKAAAWREFTKALQGALSLMRELVPAALRAEWKAAVHMAT
jgi:hypothetical protein